MWDALKSGFALGLGDSLLGSGTKFTISRLSDTGKEDIEDWELSLAKQTLNNPYAGFLGYLAGHIAGDLPLGVIRVGKSIPENIIEGKVIYHPPEFYSLPSFFRKFDISRALPSPQVPPLAKILNKFSIKKVPDILPLAILDKDKIVGIVKLPKKALPPPSSSDVLPLAQIGKNESGLIPLGISRVFISDKSAPKVKYGIPTELLGKAPRIFYGVDEMPSNIFRRETIKSAIPIYKKAVDFIKAHPVLSSMLGLGGAGLTALTGYGLYKTYQDKKTTEEILNKIKELQEKQKQDTAIPTTQQTAQPKSAVPNIDIEGLARIMGDPRATMAFYSLAMQMLSNYVNAQQQAQQKLADTRMKLLEKMLSGSSGSISDIAKLFEVLSSGTFRENPALRGYFYQLGANFLDDYAKYLKMKNLLNSMLFQELTGRAIP